MPTMKAATTATLMSEQCIDHASQPISPIRVIVLTLVVVTAQGRLLLHQPIRNKDLYCTPHFQGDILYSKIQSLTIGTLVQGFDNENII